MDELRAAVESGLVTVSPRGRGFLVTGAVDDLLVLPELEALGAVWMPKQQGYYIEHDEAAARELKRISLKSAAVAAALAARRERAADDGARLFDNQRARQQRKMARELREVYQQALQEHQAELRRVMAQYEGAQDPAEAVNLAYRRDELASVIEGLTEGLANAGRAAAALTDSRLAEAAAISRNISEWQLDNMAGFRVARFIANDTASLAITGVATYHGKYDLEAWDGVADKRKARQIIKQSISRGLLTGEHPSKVATRLEGLFTGKTPLSPYKRAVRIAQTEMHSVMNQAAYETMVAAEASGLKMKKQWNATLDDRTRSDHRKVDGEIVDLDKPFSNGLMRPGDGGAADRINCRCKLVEVLEGFKPDANLRRENVPYIDDDGERHTGKTIPYMTYEEWEKKMMV
jgi:SPP1 gp7 family putative phage head morphogenesis protein